MCLTVVESTVVVFEIIVECVDLAELGPLFLDVSQDARLLHALQPLAQLALRHELIMILVYLTHNLTSSNKQTNIKKNMQINSNAQYI